MSWEVQLGASIAIGAAYFVIAWLIAGGLWRSRQVTSNRLGLATALIFFTCGMGHALHAGHMISSGISAEVRDSATWTIALWDVLTAFVALNFLAQRRHFGRLLTSDSPVLFEDMTAKRDQELHRVQHAFTLALSSSESSDDVASNCLESLGRTMSWDFATFWRVEEQESRLTCESVWSAEGAGAEGSISALLSDPELPGSVLAGEAPMWSRSMREEPCASIHPGAGVDSMVGVPVTSGEQTLAVIMLFSRERRSSESAPDGLLPTLAAQLGEFMERKRAEHEAQRLKDEFFALVSHELRTPLTAIIGYLDLVKDEPGEFSPQTTKSLEVVGRNAERLMRLVGDLLFVAQVEAGAFELASEPVNLAKIVTQSVEASSPRAVEAGIDLTCSIGSSAHVSGDPDRLHQALDNLVSNAIKFSDEGGRIKVELTDSGDRATIVVSDDGVGIEDDDLDRLFTRFFQANGDNGSTSGVGLGLAITKAIVQGHGGEIEVESEPGAGSTFRISLPVEAPRRSVNGNGRRSYVEPATRRGARATRAARGPARQAPVSRTAW